MLVYVDKNTVPCETIEKLKLPNTKIILKNENTTNEHCNQYRFVGEYVYADESRSNYHIDELKRFL